MTPPKYAETFCSQCGRSCGPGDHGYSHCDQHPGAKRDALLRRQSAAHKGWETRRAAAARTDARELAGGTASPPRSGLTP